MADLNNMISMPPGWDTKHDSKTGKSFYYNHITKNASLDDPRIRFKQIQSEDIPLQSLQDYSSSSGRASPIPSYRSFGHSPAHSQRSYSPTLGCSSIYKENIYNIEDSIAKISLLFPTVEESHIRQLLMKYHNREAVVISALQVEKHPICTPGPYTPPPVLRRRYMTSSTITSSPSSSPRPNVWRNFSSSPSKPPHSPKMKLRYLKSVFPVVDDTVLLDTLSSSDNNVNTATETLLTMGFTKKLTTSSPRITLEKQSEEDKKRKEKEEEDRKIDVASRMKTLEEKETLKQRLQNQFPNIPERVVNLALEVVDYRETMAAHILDMTTRNEKKSETNNSINDETDNIENIERNNIMVQRPSTLMSLMPSPSLLRKSVVIPDQPSASFVKRPKGKSNPKVSRGTSTTEDKNYKSKLIQSPQGPNPELLVGPQEQNILPDYVPWNGPNDSLLFKSKIKPKGPNKLLLSIKTIFAKGPNKNLVKGPRKGLAKGSIYAQHQIQESISCN